MKGDFSDRGGPDMFVGDQYTHSLTNSQGHFWLK